MSVFVYILKADDSRLTYEELAAAANKATGCVLREEAVVEVPYGKGKRLYLYMTSPGALAFELWNEDADEVLEVIRRFASGIDGAVVEAEGEVFEPLPWESHPPTAAG